MYIIVDKFNNRNKLLLVHKYKLFSQTHIFLMTIDDSHYILCVFKVNDYITFLKITNIYNRI